ncbi:protein S100-A10b [Myripristis murdjan]|uniref:Protein S100 n=1 Tax=Myripristis murdjan TaxID=586833 RepID=A0A667Z9G6_9TELE|nr:protein S100-A1-like [Myripristis murdjan]
MPSDLETSIENMIMVFHRYAEEDGDKNTLTKKELKKLLEMELSSFLKSQKDTETVNKIMKDLDSNKDGKVDFEEFVPLVVGLSIACEQMYKFHKQKPTKK